jgi:hypothetical protein
VGGRICGGGCKQGLSPAGAGSAVGALITAPNDFMKRLGLHLCFLFLVLAFALSVADAAGHPLDTWHTRQPASDSGDLFGVCHGQRRFVAVGPDGTILTSSTGEIWNVQSSGSTVSLWAVTCGDGLFVAVGEAGVVLSSPDGMNWTTQASGVMTHLLAVQFGSGRFVVTGADNVILSSSDGISWARQTSTLSMSSDLRDIVYGNGYFFVPGPGAFGRNLTSPDGTNWTAQSTDLVYSPGLYTVGFGAGRFLIVNTQVEVFSSTDAIHWTQQGNLTGGRQPAIAYGSGHFVTGSGGQMDYSRDGRVWTSAPAACLPRDICYGNGTFVAVGYRRAIVQSDPVVCLETFASGTVEISGPTERTYRIDSRDSARTGDTWITRSNFTLQTSPQVWSDPDPVPPPQRFYRAVVEP